MVRLGVVFVAGAALLTAFLLVAIADGERKLFWLEVAILVEALTGVLMMMGNRVGAAFAALQLLCAGVAGAVSTVGDLSQAAGASVLDVGNAVASTTIFVWLCGIAVLGLFAPQRRTAWVTIRVIGACLAVVAASHLYLATAVGLSTALAAPLGAISINFNLAGTTVWGFPGWPLWHGALAVTALTMTFAPRAMLRRTCSVLFVLFALLAPLTLVSLLAQGIHGGATVVQLLVWSCLVFPLYLIWWLTDNAS